MEVVPEGGSLFMHNMTMIADGHTTIEHSLPVANIYDDVMQFWRGSKTAYTPTLIVAYGGAVRRELLVPAHRRLEGADPVALGAAAACSTPARAGRR